MVCPRVFRSFVIASLVMTGNGYLFGADYQITTNGTTLEMIDVNGLADELTVSEPLPGHLQISATGRTFQVNGGPDLNTSSGSISLTGIQQVILRMGGGNDDLQWENFTAPLPNISIQGQSGNDFLDILGAVPLQPNASFHADFEDSGSSSGMDEIMVRAGGSIIATGSGHILLRCSRNGYLGVGARLETVHGDLTLEMNQTATPISGNFIGLGIIGATVEVKGTGLLHIKARGGDGSGINCGILMQQAAVVRGGTTNAATIHGTGGAGAGSNNIGLQIENAATVVTTHGASLLLTGQGGGASTSSSCYGILVNIGAQISAPVAERMELTGNSGLGGGNNQIGIYLTGAGSVVTSLGGPIEMHGNGLGTGTGSFGYGLYLESGAKISPTNTAPLTITAKGSDASGSGNFGTFIVGTNTGITAGGGHLTIQSVGGSGNGINNRGLQLQSSASIGTTGTGTIQITATGGSGSGTGNYGLRLVATSTITSHDGAITLRGLTGNESHTGFALSNAGSANSMVKTSGSGSISIYANRMDISTSNVSIEALAGSITLTTASMGKLINLGSSTNAAADTLELSDAELDRCLSPQLQLGSAQTGALTVTQPLSRNTATQWNFSSGAEILTLASISNPGGSCHFTPTTYLQPAGLGVDVTAATVSLQQGALRCAIQGSIPDTEYTQWHVDGTVQLNAATLELTGSHQSSLGQQFILVQQTGGAPWNAIFIGRPQDSLLTLNQVPHVLSYTAGNGNELALTPQNLLQFAQLAIHPIASGSEEIQATITGGLAAANLSLRLESSADLVQWTPLATRLADGAGTVQFTTINLHHGNRQFYRVVTP
jgi:hypothetical protein